MRRLILIFIFCFFVFFTKAYAIDLSINNYTVASESIEYTRGFQIEAGDKLRLAISYEQGLIYFAGQETIDLKLVGLLLLREWKFNNLSMAIGAGYYFPDISEATAFREGMCLEINHSYPEGVHVWTADDIYRYEIHGNIGGLIKVGALIWHTKHLSLGLDAGYRFLKLREVLTRDHSNYDPDSWIEFNRCQDLSGGFVAMRFQVSW